MVTGPDGDTAIQLLWSRCGLFRRLLSVVVRVVVVECGWWGWSAYDMWVECGWWGRSGDGRGGVWVVGVEWGW